MLRRPSFVFLIASKIFFFFLLSTLHSFFFFFYCFLLLFVSSVCYDFFFFVFLLLPSCSLRVSFISLLGFFYCLYCVKFSSFRSHTFVSVLLYLFSLSSSFGILSAPLFPCFFYLFITARVSEGGTVSSCVGGYVNQYLCGQDNF